MTMMTLEAVEVETGETSPHRGLEVKMSRYVLALSLTLATSEFRDN